MCHVARTVTCHAFHDDDVYACVVLNTTTDQLTATLDLHNCAIWTLADHPLLLSDDANKVLDGGSSFDTCAIFVRHPDMTVVVANKDARVLRPCYMLAASMVQQQEQQNRTPLS